MEQKHGKPVFTSGMTQVEALRALGAKKVLGVTYFTGDINKKYSHYFSEAGFEMLGMEGISVPFADVGRLSPQEVYAFVKEEFLKHPGPTWCRAFPTRPAASTGWAARWGRITKRSSAGYSA